MWAGSLLTEIRPPESTAPSPDATPTLPVPTPYATGVSTWGSKTRFMGTISALVSSSIELPGNHIGKLIALDRLSPGPPPVGALFIARSLGLLSTVRLPVFCITPRSFAAPGPTDVKPPASACSLPEIFSSCTDCCMPDSRLQQGAGVVVTPSGGKLSFMVIIPRYCQQHLHG